MHIPQKSLLLIVVIRIRLLSLASSATDRSILVHNLHVTVYANIPYSSNKSVLGESLGDSLSNHVGSGLEGLSLLHSSVRKRNGDRVVGLLYNALEDSFESRGKQHTSKGLLVLSKVLIEELRALLQEGGILHDGDLSTDASSGGNVLFGSLNQTVCLVTRTLLDGFQAQCILTSQQTFQSKWCF